MKNKPLLKSHFFKISFVLLSIFFVLISCRKDEPKTVPVKEKENNDKISKEQLLIRYLSISFEVKASEISYNSDSTEFIIRGHHLNRAEIETRYENANVYHNTYGK